MGRCRPSSRHLGRDILPGPANAALDGHQAAVILRWMASKVVQTGTEIPPKKTLSPAAERALAEAAQRRAESERTPSAEPAKEVGGPSGPEPTRYGDWEKKGLTSDF